MTVPPSLSPAQAACAAGDHETSTDPRREGWCVRCGQRVTNGRLHRDRWFEDEATRQLGSGTGIDPEPLNVFASRRADSAQHRYGHDFPSLERNLERETLEELADARNYIVWRLDAIHRGLCEEIWRVDHLQRALKHVVLAFEDVRQALG